ncbi:MULTISPECIES: ribonuclease R [unclassified Agarivorans]|uniref:ribonuclease R n=1 Tax=unclassified Agarivorans TaxID=2636026 RepID=UPI0026E2F44A|nr:MULTISPECIES: ribonuclease R [unclassified Agarivorans]MDO6686948.1 ribonuclease R [Agarivorans sp. 3_MG-2023]MDO6716745.1 ribonuclease R [Agarivorans sp. 2_MG-2023]
MQNQAASATLTSTILNALTEEMAPVSKDWLHALCSEEQQTHFSATLTHMLEEGLLVTTRIGAYTLPERLGLVTGTIIGHRDGFGFLKTTQEGTDLFLPAKEMRKVFHNDFVLAAPSSMDKKGRREGQIIKVLKAGKVELVGRYFVEGNHRYVVPDDSRINQDILIGKNDTAGARQGQVVVIEVLSRPAAPKLAVGKVTDILGEKMAPGMEVQVALRNHDIPHDWPNAVTKAVSKLEEEVDEASKQNRVDLRDLPLVTIDGEDARDFDDAVFCEAKKSGGWRLWVAIADVSYYVRPDAALDREALNRGNSVYFPDQVIPMLPEQLSNGLCSLNPQVDRLCMVAEMTISAAGRLSGYKFYEAVMHSHARFTYNKVAAILDGDEALAQRYADQVPHLQELHRLYSALKVSRAQRGGIELETQETRFIFNAQRKIEQIVPLTRNDAHKMIEECMIQANVAAAKFVEKHQQAILYRVHDRPGKERLTNFRGFLNELGLPLGGGDEPQPSDYFTLVASIQERPDLELIQTMLLRSMMQAVYQPDNLGHFGLALKSYAHFTSPIRRYPDLLLHRVIKFLVNKLEAEAAGKIVKNKWTVTGGYSYQDDEMDKFGEACSMTERRADDATREVSDSLKCEYMQDHVGTVLPATIAAVTGFGFFARLEEFHIDGLVHINSLRGDYYHYDAARQILVGEKTGKRFRIGDAVTVKVASVNMADRKMEFVIVNKDGQADEFDRPQRSGKDGGRGKRFTKPGEERETTGRNGGKKKPRHRDTKNKGKRRKPSTASDSNKDPSSENKGGFSPWQQRDPDAKKAKPNNDAKAKPRKKPKKKRKQRPGKQERTAAKQQKN